MAKKIDTDVRRFKKIIRGKIRKDLKKYITQGELIGRKGKHLVSIPLPRLDTPRFKFGSNRGQGVGQGEGQVGDPVPGQEESDGYGGGEETGQHLLEVEVTLQELAEILGEELELPKIQPKGKNNIVAERDKYTGIRSVGPEGLRHFKRTYKQALRRQLASGLYDPKQPIITPIREDRRYLSWKSKSSPQNNAVVIYMMDVSGSMGSEQKEVVRIESFWIDTWLRSQYKDIDVRYIVHDAAAREVDQHTFYHLRESGGTKISSAYELCNRMIDEKYPPSEWNIYPFHFSDGDNWSGKDTARCVELLEKEIFPKSNIFCYGQVKSAYGSGQFKNDLDKQFGTHEDIVTCEIPNREGILDSIKAFLGKGK